MRASGNKRERGAYFTPTWVAQSLAGWCIRTARDQVLDPAAGRGDLLAAAAEQLLRVGAKPQNQVFGVELHAGTVRGLRTRLSAFASSQQLLRGDFFALSQKLPKCDVVMANPPYVRHQEIPVRGLKRMRAALDGRAHLVGGKASAWAYFLLHAPDLLKPHGRMAFVLPAEVLTSDYAAPVVDYLASHFKTVKFVYCDGAVFPGLSQQTVLCLTDDYVGPGNPRGSVEWGSIQVGVTASQKQWPHLNHIAWDPLRPDATLVRLLAPIEAVESEGLLRGRQDIKCLGDVASVGIGYVTGANRFFHLSEQERKKVNLHARHLSRVVTRSRAIEGLEFTRNDWGKLRAGGDKCWLLTPKSSKDKKIHALLERARRAKIHKAYKCRSRSCWWNVPIKDAPPAFMAYMGANIMVLVNKAAVRVPNSLYEVRELKGISARELAVASVTSVFQLSAILNGRLLGGGLMKLEPSDAARILVPTAHVSSSVAREIDRLVRLGRVADARKAADKALLVKALGLSVDAVRRIQRVLSALQEQRPMTN